jgi:hypothetical protein
MTECGSRSHEPLIPPGNSDWTDAQMSGDLGLTHAPWTKQTSSFQTPLLLLGSCQILGLPFHEAILTN